MIYRGGGPRMETFIPEINGGVPTNALGSALARKLARQEIEQVLKTVAPGAPQTPTTTDK